MFVTIRHYPQPQFNILHKLTSCAPRPPSRGYRFYPSSGPIVTVYDPGKVHNRRGSVLYIAYDAWTCMTIDLEFVRAPHNSKYASNTCGVCRVQVRLFCRIPQSWLGTLQASVRRAELSPSIPSTLTLCPGRQVADVGNLQPEISPSVSACASATLIQLTRSRRD